MAVGPTLGTGVFIASGQALAIGGPLSLLLAYLFLSGLSYSFATAAAQVADREPVRHGTMFRHSSRYAVRSFTFTLGYLRWYTLAMLVPYEITTAMVNLGMWHPGVKTAIRMSVVSSIIVGFNFLPERAFKRSETIFTGIKLGSSLGLLLVSAIVMIKDIPGDGPVRGFTYWHEPGAMHDYLVEGGIGRLLGLVQCVLYSSVAFILTPELTVTRAEETGPLPHRSVVATTHRDSIQLFVLYLLQALAVGVIVPYDDPGLRNGDGAGTSPYILGIQNARINDLPSVVMVLILLSSVASGRSFLFQASRMLCSLADSGHAPAAVNRRNRWDVPYVAVASTLPFAGLAWLSMLTSSTTIFNWFMHFITASGYLSWIACGILYLRFRRELQQRGELPPATGRIRRIQPWATYAGMVTSAMLLLTSLSTFAWPSGGDRAQSVATGAAIVTFLGTFVAHRTVTIHSSPDTASDEIEIDVIAVEPQSASDSNPVEVREREIVGSTPDLSSPEVRERTTPKWWRRLRLFIEGPYGLDLPTAEEPSCPA